MSASSTNYLMGHSDHERRRLALQALVLNPLTEEFLLRAGLTAGMSVLDLGCGVGDVAMIAGRLVGPAGHVTAIDIDTGALDVSRARAREAGLTHITFEHSDITAYSAPEPFDAVVGRHILIHTANPLRILQGAAAQVRPGGIVAFQEYDLSRFVPSKPPKPLFEKISQIEVDFFTRVTHADIGMRLFQLFHDAELTSIHSQGEFILDGGPDCLYYEWTAETLRSLLPKLEATGVATARDLDVDTLAERLNQEALTVGGCLAGPVIVGAFGRRP